MAISSKDGREHKKPRLAHTMPTVTFKTGAELRQALRTADSDQLVKGEEARPTRENHRLVTECTKQAFTSFRNQISMRSNEASIPLSDERVVFVHSWLEGEPDAQCVFDVWGQTNAVRELHIHPFPDTLLIRYTETNEPVGTCGLGTL
jgi:hypothetical protein